LDGQGRAVTLPKGANKSKHWLANIFLIFFAIVIASLLFELGLRLAGVSYPSFYQSDEHTGKSLRPGIGRGSETRVKPMSARIAPDYVIENTVKQSPRILSVLQF
jgi:hypothetical protein